MIADDWNEGRASGYRTRTDSEASAVGMEREARNEPKAVAVAIDRLRARMNTRAERDWTYFVSGGEGDDLRSLITAYESQAERLREVEAENVALREAIQPFSRLEIPARSVGNAGAYSIRHDHIRRAVAALTQSPPATEKTDDRD